MQEVGFASASRLRKLSQVLNALLACNCLSRSLTSPGVGTCSLTTDRQALLVSYPSIALNFTQAMNALADLSTERSFYGVVAFKSGRKTAQFVFVQIPRLLRWIDFGLHACLTRDDRPNAIEILKRIDDLLVIRNINTKKTRHACLLLNLFLP